MNAKRKRLRVPIGLNCREAHLYLFLASLPKGRLELTISGVARVLHRSPREVFDTLRSLVEFDLFKIVRRRHA